MTPDQTYSPMRTGHPSREPDARPVSLTTFRESLAETARLRGELNATRAKLDTYRRCASMMTDFARKHGNAFMVDGIVDLYAKAMREAGAQ